MAAFITQYFESSKPAQFDWSLCFIPLILASVGFIMVASASIYLAAESYGDPWYFTKRHAVFLALAATTYVLILCLPSELWHRYGALLLIAGIVILGLVLMPGIGRRVNGAQRWISMGPFTLQASEVAKFCFVIFFASFLSRRTEEFQTSWKAFFNLLVILGVFVSLLLAEPDFGNSVVLCITAGAMMFIAGVPVIRFTLLVLVGVIGLLMLAVLSPYRWQRLVSFWNPWEDPFHNGYQLTQSLIAFGRGEWAGLGLGNSLQKLFFLPEAHTDFIFAIVAEELGFIGAALLVLIFFTLVWRIFYMAYQARAKNLFIAFTSIGVGVLLGAQALINMSVACGLMPTKGITLPFVSSGGSSLIISFAFMALIFRMNMELAWERERE